MRQPQDKIKSVILKNTDKDLVGFVRTFSNVRVVKLI